jgi:hypothetical protein
MKKSQLKRIVKEEIKKVVKEEEQYTDGINVKRMIDLHGKDWDKKEEKPKSLSFKKFIDAASGTLHHRGQINQIQTELVKHIYKGDYKSIKKDIMEKFGLDEYGNATF